MFSLFNGRQQYYEKGTKNNKNFGGNEDKNQTPSEPDPSKQAIGIEDQGIIVDNHHQVPISPFGTNSYAVDDDFAPSELSSSAYGGSSYQQQEFPDTPHYNDPPAASNTTPSPGQSASSNNNPNNNTTMAAVPNQTNPRQTTLSPKPSAESVHAISYVTQAPEHGYTAGHEDDLSTLGDESIIRRGRRGRKQQQQEIPKQQQQQTEKKQKRKKNSKEQATNNKSFDKTKISKAHTKSTEEISPSNASRDLSFSFSNVLDVNEKIPDSSRLGYEITDDSLTDRGQNKGDGSKGDGDEETAFLQRNKWSIIKFIVAISLFLLMAAATVLVVSLLHMRTIENQTEALTMSNGGYASEDSESSDELVSLPPLVSVPEPVFPEAVEVVSTFSPTTLPPEPAEVATSATTSPPTSTASMPWADKITESPTKSPTITTAMPTSALTSEPTSSPTTATIETSNGLGNIANANDDSEFKQVGTDLRFVIANFSPSSLSFLEDPNSAQFKAFDWMIKDPNYWTMEISTIIQRWTLAVLYYSTGGPNWQTKNFPNTYRKGKSPWLSYSDECMWESSNMGTRGRICDTSNNLFAVHLRGVGLTGTLPAELSLLSDHMRLLFVNGNELTGTLPSELGQLTALEKINLQYNNFSGSLPSEIGRWGALTIASMGNNQFSGQIPSETGNWNSLHTIGFEQNIFYGTLPKEWANMPYLEKISIEHNFLTGTIPYDFNFMYQLTSLSMQHNDLTGEMQSGLCPGENSVEELLADCQQVLCECCTSCFIDRN